MVPGFILVENLEIATYIHDNDTESTVTEDENHRASGDAGETEHGLHVSSGGTRGCHLGVVLNDVREHLRSAKTNIIYVS